MATDAISNDELEAIATELRAAVENLVTEDDVPVDNVFSEKQQRLLTEPLFSSWQGPGQAAAVRGHGERGLFFALRRPPLVPDVLLSLGVKLPADIHLKHNRSYFVWEYGKAPEVVIEIVSNREGGEDTDKLATYAEIGIRYYVIHDPDQILGTESLRVSVSRMSFHKLDEPIWFREVGLGLGLWQGRYEDMEATWLRWVDATGTPVPTGSERAEAERQRAEAERQRAEQLAAQLRQLGVEPR